MTGTPADDLLFRPIRVGSMDVAGRVWKTATTETRAGEDGRVGDAYLRFHEPIAAGGTPLIITGNLHVSPSGRATYRNAGIESDDKVEGLSRLTTMVHRHGARIVAQINHCGRQTNPRVGGYERAVAPSAVLEKTGLNLPRAMTLAEIGQVTARFADAAGRAQRAGFDGVQVHMAHGYLLSEFLTPHTNRRKDEYGGTFENRLRLPREVLRAVRARVGADFPLLVKINGADLLMVEGGLDTHALVRVAQALVPEGVDAFEISCGHYESGFPMLRGRFDDFLKVTADRGQGVFLPPWRRALLRALNGPLARFANRRWPAQEGFNLEFARAFRQALSVPVIVVGGFHTREAIEQALRTGAADAVSVGRAMIADPFFVQHLREGTPGPRCDYCNQCAATGAHLPLDCYNPSLTAPRRAMLEKAGFATDSSAP